MVDAVGERRQPEKASGSAFYAEVSASCILRSCKIENVTP